ncbi:MAG TPA: hypothetical protein DC024_10315 [Clostridiales bacterium]|nr:hypothetical protein [Clostridiales bacterium]
MDNVTVTADTLGATIAESLQEFSDEKMKEIKGIISEKSKECANNIKRDSPKRNGNYAKGWTATKQFEDNLNISYVVHNKTDWQLTHLLENGHANRDGSRTEGIPHIEPNCEKIEAEIDEAIEKTAGD